jgi:hypothetical protein
MKALTPNTSYVSSDIKNPSFLAKPLKDTSDILASDNDKYTLSFYDIFKNRIAGEKIFSYLSRLGLIRKLDNGKFAFAPKTRSGVLPIVCLYNTLNAKGYLKRMTQTEAGYYFCRAFGKNNSSIRMFYLDQLKSSKKYDEYFYHIPEYSTFMR